MLTNNFFDQDAQTLAKALLGKVIHAKYKNIWLSAMIIETEAYYLDEKSSHASLGFTEKRKALFMPPGTIYMYYARGDASINISGQGEGNAVLIKSGIPHLEQNTSPHMLPTMQKLNPIRNFKNNTQRQRPTDQLCSGQTLLCRALNLKVTDWDQKNFDPQKLHIDDVGYTPTQIIQTTRLGIPENRDAHLPYRFIDHQHAHRATRNPLTQRTPSNYALI